MKTYFTTVKYAPNPDREEYFGIGLIMVSPESSAVKVRFSRERVNRINHALGIAKSSLFESAMRHAEGLAKSTEPLDVKHLEYLAVYENGVIRYAPPKPLVIAQDNPDKSNVELMDQRFDRLYQKLIADKQEKSGRTSKGFALATAFRRKAKKDEVFKSHLDIDYRFDSIELQADILFPDISVDFIGGNGSIYCGNFIDLGVQEKTLQKNIAETFLARNFLASLFDGASPSSCSQCKIILDKEQAESIYARQALHSIKLGLEKEPHNLLIVPDTQELMDRVLEEVKEKNVEPFSNWIRSHPPKAFQYS